MASLIRLLFLSSLGFLFFSASTAATWELQGLRVFLFSGLMGSLFVLVFAFCRVQPSNQYSLAVILAGLLSLISLVQIGRTPDLYDLKIVLPILAIGLSPFLATIVDGDQLTWNVRRLIGIYIAVTGASYLLGNSSIDIHRFQSIARVDFSGSVILHSGLCVIYVVIGLSAIWSRQCRYVSLELLLATAAVAMLMLTATRTTIITLSLFGCLALFVGRRNTNGFRSVVLFSLLAIFVFLAFSLMVDDSLLRRLAIDENQNFSSGRYHSITHWLELVKDSPFGLGLGTIRDSLLYGRPALDGERLLEWPHNELVRFYVEAGYLGLAFLLTLLVGVLAVALKAAERTTNLVRRNLILVIMADMFAQIMLQNYFNTIYHSTVLLLVALVLSARGTMIRPLQSTWIGKASERDDGEQQKPQHI